MDFVDSNVLIRVVTFDDPVRLKKAKEYLNLVAALQKKCYTSEAVIAEVFYVCISSRYGLDREEVVNRLMPILSLENFFMDHKKEVILALEKCLENGLDFVDCLALSYQDTGVVDGIFSFDKKVNQK